MRLMVSLAAAALATVALGGQAAAECSLANGIEHIVYLQFDNVHLRRDIPNVPSDLEQMPNLLQFLEGEGTLFTNHHTPLISHTAVDILTSLTGVYGDKFGVPIGNSFGLFSIRERLKYLGGSVLIESIEAGLTKGTRATLIVPIHRSQS